MPLVSSNFFPFNVHIPDACEEVKRELLARIHPSLSGWTGVEGSKLCRVVGKEHKHVVANDFTASGFSVLRKEVALLNTRHSGVG